ncbi:MAG: DUF4363 family protein [Ruminococcus sp.]|nr:DUF4363 family protein [Ruminococcus sp.]
MKRIYITVLLLIFAGFICVYEFMFVSKNCDDFVYKINNLQKAYMNNEREEALMLSADINEDWNEQVKKIDMLLYHDYVDAITVNMSKLSIYIREEEAVSFYSTCREITDELESLKNSEIPNLENII